MIDAWKQLIQAIAASITWQRQPGSVAAGRGVSSRIGSTTALADDAVLLVHVDAAMVCYLHTLHICLPRSSVSAFHSSACWLHLRRKSCAADGPARRLHEDTFCRAHIDAVQPDEVAAAVDARQRLWGAEHDEVDALSELRRLLRRWILQHEVHHPVCSSTSSCLCLYLHAATQVRWQTLWRLSCRWLPSTRFFTHSAAAHRQGLQHCAAEVLVTPDVSHAAWQTCCVQG